MLTSQLPKLGLVTSCIRWIGGIDVGSTYSPARVSFDLTSFQTKPITCAECNWVTMLDIAARIYLLC